MTQDTQQFVVGNLARTGWGTSSENLDACIDEIVSRNVVGYLNDCRLSIVDSDDGCEVASDDFLITMFDADNVILRCSLKDALMEEADSILGSEADEKDCCKRLREFAAFVISLAVSIEQKERKVWYK